MRILRVADGLSRINRFSCLRAAAVSVLAIGVAIFIVAAPATASPYITPAEVYTTGGTLVYITTDETIGCYQCPPPDVLFDGVRSATVTSDGGHLVTAVAPPHPEEAMVTIKVVTPAKTITIEGQFAYVLQRDLLLVPLAVDSLQGYGGSNWSTDLWVHNDSDQDVSLSPKICNGFLGLQECGGPRLVIRAKSSLELPPGPLSWAIGTFYPVPHSAAGQVTFDLRLFDTTHPETSAVTVPVARMTSRSRLVLLNVPEDAHSRALLRIYSSEPGSILTYAVHVYDLETGEKLADQSLEIGYPTDSGPIGLAASTSDIFETPQVRRARKLRVEVESAFPISFWAMVSVTDNATQHVTIIAPMP